MVMMTGGIVVVRGFVQGGTTTKEVKRLCSTHRYHRQIDDILALALALSNSLVMT